MTLTQRYARRNDYMRARDVALPAHDPIKANRFSLKNTCVNAEGGMTTFDKREEGFEKKFAHDEELQFKAMRPAQQAARPVGGGKARLAGAEAEAYAKEVVLVGLRGSRRSRRF